MHQSRPPMSPALQQPACSRPKKSTIAILATDVEALTLVEIQTPNWRPRTAWPLIAEQPHSHLLIVIIDKQLWRGTLETENVFLENWRNFAWRSIPEQHRPPQGPCPAVFGNCLLIVTCYVQ